MFKVSSILTGTAMQSLSPVTDCSINDVLVKALQFRDQWFFFQMINFTDPANTQSNQSDAADDFWMHHIFFQL